jgi:hypothetical protein
MPSIPSVGSRSIGTGEKYFNPLESSGFFNNSPIRVEKKNKKIENIKPDKKRPLDIFQTMSLPCSRVYLGKK